MYRTRRVLKVFRKCRLFKVVFEVSSQIYVDDSMSCWKKIKSQTILIRGRIQFVQAKFFGILNVNSFRINVCLTALNNSILCFSLKNIKLKVSKCRFPHFSFYKKEDNLILIPHKIYIFLIASFLHTFCL